MGRYAMTPAELRYFKGQIVKQLAWVNAQLELPADDQTVPDEPRTAPADQLDLAMRNLAQAMDRTALLIGKMGAQP